MNNKKECSEEKTIYNQLPVEENTNFQNTKRFHHYVFWHKGQKFRWPFLIGILKFLEKTKMHQKHQRLLTTTTLLHLSPTSVFWVVLGFLYMDTDCYDIDIFHQFYGQLSKNGKLNSPKRWWTYSARSGHTLPLIWTLCKVRPHKKSHESSIRVASVMHIILTVNFPLFSQAKLILYMLIFSIQAKKLRPKNQTQWKAKKYVKNIWY